MGCIVFKLFLDFYIFFIFTRPLTLLDAAVFVHFAIVIPALHSRLSDRNQIWHTYSDGYGTDSNLNMFDPPDPRGCQGGF